MTYFARPSDALVLLLIQVYLLSSLIYAGTMIWDVDLEERLLRLRVTLG